MTDDNLHTPRPYCDQPKYHGPRDMVIGDLLNLDMLKEAIEVEFIGTLWVKGDSGPMTPYVCEASFGDGFNLLTVSTINQRPNYHVVRVDSRWEESNWADGDTVGDHIDEVIDAIEDECGRAGVCLDEPCDNCGDTCCTCRPDYETREDWPCIEADDGCAWGFIRWDWLMKTIGGTAADCLPRTWADIHLARLTNPTPPPCQPSRPALPHEGMTSHD